MSEVTLTTRSQISSITHLAELTLKSRPCTIITKMRLRFASVAHANVREVHAVKYLYRRRLLSAGEVMILLNIHTALIVKVQLSTSQKVFHGMQGMQRAHG